MDGKQAERGPPDELLMYIRELLSTIKYGEVTIVIHDGQAVRIDTRKREKLK